MEVETARYLLSALIQAVAMAWGLVVAAFVFLIRNFLDRFSDIETYPPEDARKEEKRFKIWLKERKELVEDIHRRYKIMIWELILVSILVFSTVASGSGTLVSIDIVPLPEFAVYFTLVLSIVTFFFLALYVAVLVYSGIVIIGRWRTSCMEGLTYNEEYYTKKFSPK